MRSESEMMSLIMGFAEHDKRVRAVYMNGSRTNPNAPKDIFQDYDIVYVVRNFEEFKNDHSFIDYFGERLMLQMPEAMRDPLGYGHFNWMMLFQDGNRLDLTLIPIERPDLITKDSLTEVLLDKDGILPDFPPANDGDYHVQKPSLLYYDSCCNNFFWCMQNVAKGIEREEFPYAMQMFHTVVMQDLHDMLSWYIGCKNDFAVSAGKMGKYFGKFLPEEMYKAYLSCYGGASKSEMWASVFKSCDLFRKAAKAVAEDLGYSYNESDDNNMMSYITLIVAGAFYEDAKEIPFFNKNK